MLYCLCELSLIMDGTSQAIYAVNFSVIFEIESRFKLLNAYTGLFISPSGTSELDCATTKKDRAERSISIGRESLKVFFVVGALAYLRVPPLGGSRPSAPAGLFVSQRTGSHSAGISCTTHELFCP